MTLNRRARLSCSSKMSHNYNKMAEVTCLPPALGTMAVAYQVKNLRHLHPSLSVPCRKRGENVERTLCNLPLNVVSAAEAGTQILLDFICIL